MYLQSRLSNEHLILEPLQQEDFVELYAVASDPLIWEQHPNPDRYKEDVFTTYFEGAMASGGAFLVRDLGSGRAIGGTRFYDLLPDQGEVKIGYTFFSRACWGTSINRQVKTLMLDHAFTRLERVVFHVGALNIRSRKAMQKLGASQIGEEQVAYYGEPAKTNVVFLMTREAWLNR